MKKLKKLMLHCEAHDLNCALTYQKVNDYSIEIYRGYSDIGTYRLLFYTDGHSKAKKAIREGLSFVKFKK